MAKFDIDLLLVFDEIYRTGSVTRAAENLGMAQPTVSIALNKLRSHFGDQLFIRTSRGMEPTAQAQAVIGDVRAATGALQNALSNRGEFDPRKSEREFKICMTDISEIVLLPQLLNYLEQEMPRIRIDVFKISPETPAQLEAGQVDMALGFMPHLEAGFHQQILFEQNFVCLAAIDHPRIRAKLSLKAFLAEKHVVVKSSGTGHWIVDKLMAKEKIVRNIVLRVPDFLSVAHIVARTDYIVTVPDRYGTTVASEERIRIFSPPVQIPSFSVKQHWHERFHADPANKWLRQLMAQLFRTG